jgi:serine/threonine protein kinase
MIWSRGHQLQSGKYHIIRELGRGGFGVTYLAEDASLGRQVVIKTPNRQYQADQEYEKFIRRFQQEGKVLAKISHLNVVQVIEFFQEAGVPCLVMAYVDGETLNERIRNHGRLSENKAVEIFWKLATALQTVHQAGLIHCDIHPGNIMLRRQPGEPVLIDFGSAKSLQPSTVTVTTTVNQNFTPYEQQDKSRERQATLDVYALAATLYFAITGEKPQPAFNRKAYEDTLKSPQQYQPGLSDWLNQAILKGMALEPENRPQSIQEWLDLLHPSQSKQRQVQPSSPQSSSQEKPKKPQNQPHQSTFPFIPLGFVLLVSLSTGTLLGLSNADAVAWAVAWPVAWAVGGAVAGTVAAALFGAAVAAAVAAALFGAVAGAWALLVVVVVFVAAALFVGLAGAVESLFLEERYNYSLAIFIILGITSTLGLLLGGVLGWWLKLQGVSLPS